MFDVNEILIALRSGTSSDDLASQMADALNLANKTYKAELEEAKKKAEEAKRKANDLTDIIDDLLNWIECYYSDVDIPENTNTREIAEEVINTVDTLSKFSNYSISDSKTIKTVKKTADSMINDFLHELGL